MELHEGDRLGRYILGAQIGAGGMGIVWRAHDPELDRAVALKVLRGSLASDPSFIVRLRHEARALAVVQHPSIVTIYAVEDAGGLPFISMEYVDGTPLARGVPSGGLPIERFCAIAGPLVDAVATAHERGLTHRDLKPANILVTPAGAVKILDFGIAQLTSDRPAARAADPTVSATCDGSVVGTPHYMSPEQVVGRPLDARTDIFSLGAVFYFMLTGREPFPGETAQEVFASVLRDTPTPVSAVRQDVPADLVAVVDRCLAKQPAQRFTTARELDSALAAIRLDVTSAAALRSIAVLPFEDLSPDHDQEYFCEGIAEEIILALTRIRGLRVASRSSAFLARATIPDRQAVASRLGVQTLLEGSLRKAGQRLRITVELIDVTTGFNLWTERYDREMHDVFAVQDDIAQCVAQALRGSLSRRELMSIRERPTPEIHAYDLYLRGRKFFYRYSRRGMEFALRLFAQALEADPGYARAHAGVAECHGFLYMYAGAHPEDAEKASEASRRAVELAPDSAEAHAARGVALALRHDPAAEAEFARAIELNPEHFDAHYFYARTCFAAGRLADAVRLWERAAELRPEDYQSPLLVAQAYEKLGDFPLAEGARRRGVTVAEEHLRVQPDDVRALYMGANGLVALGQKEKGLSWARQALALEPEEPMVLYNIGCIYALAGLRSEALDCLEQSVGRGLLQVGWLVNDTNLDSLRAEPRFERLMEQLAAAPASPTSS